MPRPRKTKCKTVPLSEAAKLARKERKRKVHRKLDKKRRDEIRKAGGSRITFAASEETKHKLSELCRTSGKTQAQVLAAAIKHITTRDVVLLNPPKPQTAARIAAVRAKLNQE